MGSVLAKRASMEKADNKSQAEKFLRAYDQLVEGLFRFAAFRVSNKETAEDLVSQVFLRTWEYVQKGNEVQHWKVFLYRTLSNLVVDHYRSKKYETKSLDGLGDENKFEIVDEAQLPSVIQQNSEARLIVASFAKLPSEQRDILWWRYVEDLDVFEIASLTGKKPASVYVSIHRALKKARAINSKK
ncbi:sigma-70 family RNA polymerase sigma factor [Candidatus Parcubacteria bacterium]|nr:MAG: sigma-70 family RNA polymerase sigma factor [Candidatus Parcubacteria bacterium]